MKKLVAALAMTASASLAAAGYNWTVPVMVDVRNRNAQGSMGGAHNSADNQQYIGCNLSGWAGGRIDLSCYARDAANASGSCWSSDPGLIAVAATINPTTYLYFEWDVSGQCTRVHVSNTSMSNPPR